MEPTDSLEVLFERLSHGVRQHHSPILLSFPPPHGDLPPLEIEILHPQLEALLQPEPGTIEQRPHDPRNATQLVQHLSNLGRAGHDRRLRRHPRPWQQLDDANVQTQYVAIQKQDAAQRLVLR